MKRTLQEIRLYWRMMKHEIDREDEQENGLHYKRLEEYDYICDTIELIEELIKFGAPKTADCYSTREAAEAAREAGNDE